MRVEIANKIVKLVTGFDGKDALSTVAIALIHICHRLDVDKDHMLNSMSMQWDLYEKQQGDKKNLNS